MKTYKYLGTVSAECFLKDQTIRFSQPKAFNDPFELQPEFHVLDEGFIEGEARPCQFVIHGCQSSYENYLLANHTAQTQARKLDGKSIFSQLNEKIGILCLTQAETIIPANFLMWAHYAESHQGIVIEFKSDNEFIKNSSPVHYLPRRPIIDANFLYENEYVAIEDLYFKSDVWSYENEIRITKALSECKKLNVRDLLGSEVYVSEIPLDSIKCIYLGCNSSDSIKSAAIQLHKSSGINVIFLKVHDEEYKLIPYTNLGGTWSDIYKTSEQLMFDREKI
ncbi:hypothetical protein CF134_20090 [Aeromonas salmonicida]|uniref:DUF2971 domain protein n=1 Tax=Aeromonas salmonicida subsp. pectinolytica 34mel TaxID=1324960 RepID=T0PHK4_AERSA|nr:DUF2971 domain-containing protein [Aeromonas salmonicida]ATP10102.1 DUF2971 domain protein [Aeromonas salmonicida subsp. pectinolytica 34mel]EQC02196.1 hypothetical protein K931_21742 [Aeromonas salmonicida subsp. pectinolytica 34mel]TNI10911.1 hypothetical protein CF134_20090 [Aeromonas salmonicida]